MLTPRKVLLELCYTCPRYEAQLWFTAEAVRMQTLIGNGRSEESSRQRAVGVSGVTLH